MKTVLGFNGTEMVGSLMFEFHYFRDVLALDLELVLPLYSLDLGFRTL